MTTKQLEQIPTIPLIADEEKRVAFRLELTQLLNRYGVDNACNIPDYLLACHLDSYMLTVRDLIDVRDRLHPPNPEIDEARKMHQRGMSCYFSDADRYYQHLNSFKKTAEVAVRCFNCDGKGFIVPLKAVDTPTLQRWVQESQQTTHLEIDVTKLSDEEKARILHNYDWSDNAPDNALQRAGRQLMDQSGKPAEKKLPTYSSKGRGDGIFPERAEEGGASCSQ